MFSSIWEDVKREFNYGNMVTRIVIVNVGAFVVMNLVWIIAMIGNNRSLPEWFNTFQQFFMMSSDWFHNLTHPWVLITYMFLHFSFWHILWNMLFLYWFGRIVGDFIGNQRILPLYLLGGLSGAILYFISANLNLLPANSGPFMLGASASVMAIVVAAGVISPDYIMRLLFLGDVKLKYIVAVLVFLDLLGVAGMNNTGGHVAHIGGAVFGYIFVRQLREGNDLAVPVNNFLNAMGNWFQGLFAGQGRRGRRKQGPRVVYKNTEKASRPKRRKSSSKSHHRSDDRSHQERLDEILDKIKQSGYESLSDAEKEFLFNASKK
ncbi:MAG: rhomboid family intramembrane serine protease [Saprospiraceae bacterium]|nr:rhomboid family intramembrane serine protease [Saprospiraceae bacterium]